MVLFESARVESSSNWARLIAKQKSEELDNWYSNDCKRSATNEIRKKDL